MIVKMKDIRLDEFEAWSGAIDTQELILGEGKERDFESLIEELYPDGLTETQLNDILWFETDLVAKLFEISCESLTIRL